MRKIWSSKLPFPSHHITSNFKFAPLASFLNPKKIRNSKLGLSASGLGGTIYTSYWEWRSSCCTKPAPFFSCILPLVVWVVKVTAYLQVNLWYRPFMMGVSNVSYKVLQESTLQQFKDTYSGLYQEQLKATMASNVCNHLLKWLP